MKGYTRVYGFEVIGRIRKNKEILLVDLEKREICHAENVSAKRLIEAVDDETGRFAFYEQEAAHE